MADDLATGDTGNATGTINMDAAVASIGDDLFGQADSGDGESLIAERDAERETGDAIQEPVTEPPAEKVQPEQPVLRSAPKSWPKEMHPHWEKTPKEVQDYWDTREKQMLDGLDQYKSEATLSKQIREAIDPFRPMLGLPHGQEAQAVQRLLAAQYRLTNGTDEQRQGAAIELLNSLGLANVLRDELGSPATTPDPHVSALQAKMQQIEAAMSAREQQERQARHDYIQKTTSTFADAKDGSGTPLRPHFDEVADDICRLIRADAENPQRWENPEAFLQKVYEEAVWLNPVTRAKEQARLAKDRHAELIEKGKRDAEAARKAASVNVRTHDTKRAPTGPLGSMEETMRSTLKEIRERTH